MRKHLAKRICHGANPINLQNIDRHTIRAACRHITQDYVKVDVPLKRYGIYFISAESIRTQISIKIENWRPVRAKKQVEIYLLCFLMTKYGLKYYGEVNSLGYHRLLTLEKER